MLTEQRLDRADLDQATLPNDSDPVAAPFDLRQIVRGEEDRPTLGTCLGNKGQELPLHEGIEAARGLVHDEEGFVGP